MRHRHRHRHRSVLGVGVTLGAALSASVARGAPVGVAEATQDTPPPKSSYHVLSPTPRAQMRELSPDRPDITESPFTVDAGHMQLELDAIAAERDQGSTQVSVATMNLKLGLASFSDLQVIVTPYVEQEGASGFGDLTLRLKLNLWGNDGGDTAFGLLPFVTLPTATNQLGSGHTEGGLILPLSAPGPWGFDVSTMLEMDAAYHDDHYAAEMVVSCSVGHNLVSELDGYLELVSGTPLDTPDESELELSTGLVLGLDEDVTVDTGTRIGLTESAPDLALFVGGTARY